MLKLKNKDLHISSKDFMSTPAYTSYQFPIIIHVKLFFELKTCTLKKLEKVGKDNFDIFRIQMFRAS